MILDDSINGVYDSDDNKELLNNPLEFMDFQSSPQQMAQLFDAVPIICRSLNLLNRAELLPGADLQTLFALIEDKQATMLIESHPDIESFIVSFFNNYI